MRIPGYYTSGQFAKMAHISVRTVRYYDKQNILKPSKINESGARFYSDEDFVRLQQILLLKYLGFSLEDIRSMVVDDMDYHMLRNSLNLQLKLVKDRIEQMEMVANAIEDTTAAIDANRNIDWSQMLDLIHLTNMESSLKSQYENATNISARISLHKRYSSNQQGWFPWVYEQCSVKEHMDILELGCGNGAMWKENYEIIPHSARIVLSDISEGMLRDARRELEELEGVTGEQEVSERFVFQAFDCHEIPYGDETFDCVIANHVLFYCQDIGKVLNEVRRVLKPAGIFVCSGYGAGHMKEITDLVQGFHNQITLSADKLYEQFGLDNGEEMLTPFFEKVEKRVYEDSLHVDKPEHLIEYILSCHGNQNQYILDRYKDFRSYVEKKTRGGFHITKEAGVFVCKKNL
jgi:DNA-binding transcriptional MerR regulator